MFTPLFIVIETPSDVEDDQATRCQYRLEEAIVEDTMMERKEMIPGINS